MMGCKPRIVKDRRQRLMDRRYQKKTVRQKTISSICTGLISHRKWVFFPSSFFIDSSLSSPSLFISISPSQGQMNGWKIKMKKKGCRISSEVIYFLLFRKTLCRAKQRENIRCQQVFLVNGHTRCTGI